MARLLPVLLALLTPLTAGAETLSAARVRALFEDAVRTRGTVGGRVERVTLRDASPVRLPGPDHTVRFVFRASEDFAGPITAQLRVVDPQGRAVARRWVRGRVQRLVPGVRAARAVPAGVPLTAADLEVVELDASRVRGDALTDPDQAVGLAPRVALRPGRRLTRRLLARPLAVRRGDVVSLTAGRVGLRIRTPARVEQQGATGAVVRVTNLASGSIVVGRVVDARNVEVITP